ncbi:MAG: methyltransferase domain-containing protein [Pseudomonadota bacterium]
MLAKFVLLNRKLSATLDRVLPDRFRQDGNSTFLRDVLPQAVRPNDRVYDLGGGSRPFLSVERKSELGVQVVGLDIDAAELAAAPAGAYDQTIAHDLCTYEGAGDADVIICQATLEHVSDTAGAMRAMASTVRPGGRIFIFAPCRNAMFARLNRLLPEGVKRRILFLLFPQKGEGHDGFKAYYDRCTPSQIEALAHANGLLVEERRLFWTSSYFSVLVPAFVAWRLMQLLAYFVVKDDAAETFIYVLRKPEPPM